MRPFIFNWLRSTVSKKLASKMALRLLPVAFLLVEVFVNIIFFIFFVFLYLSRFPAMAT